MSTWRHMKWKRESPRQALTKWMAYESLHHAGTTTSYRPRQSQFLLSYTPFLHVSLNIPTRFVAAEVRFGATTSPLLALDTIEYVYVLSDFSDPTIEDVHERCPCAFPLQRYEDMFPSSWQ